MTPLTKYFCKKGYTSRIGNVETMITENRIVFSTTMKSVAAPMSFICSKVASTTTLRRISCSG